MRTKLKKLTSLCLALIMILGMLTAAPVTAGAAEETSESVSAKSGDFEYELYDDTVYITGYSGNEANLTIPSEIDGYTVTEISGSAFQGYENLTSITIPGSVTDVGYEAFANCPNLTSVTIPASVTYIGEQAFGYITYREDSFGHLVVHLKKVDGFTIYGYTNTEADFYASRNGFTFVSLGTVSLFRYNVLEDGTAAITKYVGSERDLTIPSEIDGYTVTEIGNEAFDGNTNLTSVTIPDTVTRISSNAFQICENLTSVTIPNSVTYIGENAFANTDLSSLTIPASVTEIGKSAFYGNKRLSSVTIPDSVTYIGGYAFADCPNLKSVTIPASVQNIGEYAFGYVYDYYMWGFVKADGLTISGYTGTEAERYANENGFAFVELGDIPTPSLGDVNGDGNISIDDVTDIQKYLATMVDFTNEQVSLADVDKDGKVSIDDVTLIQKYLAGIATI